MNTKLVRQLAWIGTFCFGYFAGCKPGSAQVINDNTLSTGVKQTGRLFEITRGKQVGSNLFHSFSQFSIPKGGGAIFKNGENISNIFSRVTGAKTSRIDGFIKAQGDANLTLINPNGLTFGPDARLDIGGSFLGSTADSLEFADGTEFSAVTPDATSPLTVSAPIGLQFGGTPGRIRVLGNGHRLSIREPIFSQFERGEQDAGLQVEPQQTLALVGGEVRLNGGTLTAENGQIEVGGVRNGRVSIHRSPKGFQLGYQGVEAFQDVLFRSQALADASGLPGSGFIRLQGQNVAVNGGSIILIQTTEDTSSSIGISQPAQSQNLRGIHVHGSESLTVRGTTPGGALSGGIFAETVTDKGAGAPIDVFAPDILVQGGASIFTGTFSNAAAGRIVVTAPESLKVLGFSRLAPGRFSNISATSFNSGGPAGNIIVNTGRLVARNGGNIAAVTGGFRGSGKGGDVNINASHSVRLVGVTPDIFTPSQITAGTGGDGDAGSVIIDTPRLTLIDGGRVDSSTLARGEAGRVIINAPESVEVRGNVPGTENPSLINSSANIIPTLQALLQLPEKPSGDAGGVEINTGQLTVEDGGRVTVRNDGSGSAGELIVNAESITLLDQGEISASTQSGDGGIITLTTNSVFAQHDAAINAEAGEAGTGGGITIQGSSPADSIVLLDNSDITASANMGQGGIINLNTKGLFTCTTCDISASSALGIDGEVTLLIPDTEATREGTNLIEQVIDPEEVVAQACSSNSSIATSEFTITGRGGLPPTPGSPLTSDVLIGLEAPDSDTTEQSVSVDSIQNTLPPPAQGLLITDHGKVLLTAQATETESQHLHQIAQANCHRS